MSARKKSKKLRSIKLYTLLLLVFAGLVYLIWFSPVFTISTLEVSGANLNKEQVSDLLGGNPEGENILFWQRSEGRALDARFSSIDIERDYFNRKVVVSLNQREKKYIWCFESNNSCYWVDDMGFMFSEAPISSGNLVTVIKDYRELPPAIGSYVLTSSMNNVLAGIVEILSELDLRTKDIIIEDIKLKELVVILRDETKLIFSLSTDPRFTKAAIKSLMESDSWNTIRSVNLTVQGRAYPSY